MSDPPDTDRKHAQRYSAAIRQAQAAGEQPFQAWFNKAENVEQSIVRGFWDLSVHILTPTVCSLLSEPEDKCALEIGYGGGRILNAACSFFGRTIGVDIHDEQEAVTAFLQSQGQSNFTLLRTTGRSIEVASDSVDFVYSFIVLQHLPTFEVFRAYLKETHRCLRPGGVAHGRPPL